MSDDETISGKFISIEKENQPELRSLKKQLANGILGSVGIFAGLSLAKALPVEDYQSIALAFGFTILVVFFILVFWRVWEFTRFEMGE